MALCALAAVWAYAVFHAGGVVGWDRKVYLLALGTVGLGWWLGNRGRAAAMPASLLWPGCLLPAFVAFQMVPLPAGLVALLSPARAELERAVGMLEPGETAASISVAPGITMNHFLLVCGYTLVFFLAYQMAAEWAGRRWMVFLPLAAVASAEAILGIAQSMAGQPAHGTYVDRDHYAGLLEMVLPLCLVYPIFLWRKLEDRRESPIGRVVPICLWAGAAALILTGSLLSLSRMGFLAPLFSILVMGIVAWRGSGWRSAAAIALLGCGLATAFVSLPSDQLIGRFVQSSAELGVEGRLTLWRESFRVFRAFPVFGCGLGGFESAFLRYKVAVPMVSDDHAHNDYLQFLIELGVVGFAIGAVLLAAIVTRAARAASRRNQGEDRFLAIACLGAFAAIGLHSFVDFNLYVPGNAMLLAWIAGAACGLQPAPETADHRGRARPQTPGTAPGGRPA